ncbi:hypothetical protein D3C81_177280 [compost metagenome]
MVNLIHCGIKAGQTVHAGFPGSQIAEGVDKPRQRSLHLAKSGGDLHHAAHLDGAGKIARCRHQQRENNGELAVKIGSDIEPPGDAHDRPPVGANSIKTVAQLLRLAGFAVIQRDGIVVFADADQAKTEVRLITLLVKTELNQRFADPPDQQGTQPGVQQSEPHHITGNGEGVLANHKGHWPADVPQNGDKGK